MSINPFKESPIDLNKTIQPWEKLYMKAYDKNETDPYTKTRIILMNGTEFEQVQFMHQSQRHIADNDLRRDLAYLRRLEQQQQKKIASLKPIDETILETTIGYEQLAVDLTAEMAMNEPDKYVKKALDFALLEDFDHLYRYADLLEMDAGIKAEKLVGKYTEIMPARPTISHHRHPFDEVRRAVNNKTAHPLTKLHTNIITAAEQQTMNYYMNIANFYQNDIGRQLYSEIAMVEEEHVTEYGSLIDTDCTVLESLLMHEYTEAYLYYSCYKDETDERIKKLWSELYEQEVGHLHFVAELLKKYEKKEAESIIPDGAFPRLISFQPNIEYIRDVIARTVTNTAKHEDYSDICDLPDDYQFFAYQNAVNTCTECVASHAVIEKYIKENGKDYRYEIAEHPIKSMQSRTKDDTDTGRKCVKC